jgi:hypothetical protein
VATPNYGYEKRQKELAKKKKKEDKLRAKAERKLNPGSTDGADSEAASLEQDAPAAPGTPPKDD